VTKLRLMVVVLVALAITGGGYAFAYLSSSTVVDVTSAGDEIATCEPAPVGDQPDWNSILTSEPGGTEILRPNAFGDETGITYQYPDSGEHWEKVDEDTSDGDSTYVLSNNTNWQEDLYNIVNHSTGTGTINSVRVYMVCKVTDTPGQTSAYIHLMTGGVEYNGNAELLTTSYATYSYQWNINPNTSVAWTWDEIDALQVGVGLRKDGGTGKDTLCTQVYAEVNYGGGMALCGDVPTGDLFDVTPDAGFTGDLGVKVYLTNTGDLIKAYQYLNMKLYLDGSVEAGETPNYQLLTLNNGVATFSLEDYAPGTYTLSVTGGSYCLVSTDPSEWESGYSVTPELYCQVIQMGE